MRSTNVLFGLCAGITLAVSTSACKTTSTSGSQVLGTASEVSTSGNAKFRSDGRITLSFPSQTRIITPTDTDLTVNREISTVIGTMKNIRTGVYTYHLDTECKKAAEFSNGGNAAADPDTCAVKLVLKLNNLGDLESFTYDVTTEASSGQTAQTGSGVRNWRAVPTQAEIDKMVETINSDQNPYSDYRVDAASANLDLPGEAILEAMKINRDTYKTGMGMANAGTMISCLQTGYSPTHWSDMTLHYYCTMSGPRYCYTYATSQDQLARPKAFNGCMGESVPGFRQQSYVSSFKNHIANNKHEAVYQYVMFAQTKAFNDDQQQAIINEYYGIKDPTDKAECDQKRPRRTEDPTGSGAHCLPGKQMRVKLEGRGR